MNSYGELSQKRCKNHPSREAVARCPECTGFFCRECITEHDDKVLCSACLKNILSARIPVTSKLKVPYFFLQFVTGFMVIWSIYYFFGHLLLSIPSTFHEGTFWEGIL